MNTQRVLDPKPGSPEGIAQGCTCPPQAGPDFICDQTCPVHGTADRVAPDDHLGPDNLEA
jgi:hypothetical protein